MLECITQLRLIFRKKKWVRTGEPDDQESSRAEDSRNEKKICTWRDRIDEKPGKNGGKMDFLTKVL